MADKLPKEDPVEDASAVQPDFDGDEDTEGHFMMPNIAAARAITNERSMTAERNVRVRGGRQKDERPGEKRQR